MGLAFDRFEVERFQTRLGNVGDGIDVSRVVWQVALIVASVEGQSNFERSRIAGWFNDELLRRLVVERTLARLKKIDADIIGKIADNVLGVFRNEFTFDESELFAVRVFEREYIVLLRRRFIGRFNRFKGAKVAGPWITRKTRIRDGNFNGKRAGGDEF